MRPSTLRYLRSRALRLLIVSAALAFPSTSAFGDEAEGILDKMVKATEPGKDMRATFELTITNPNGERVSWTGEYFRKSDRKRVVFHAPIDIRGVDLVAERDSKGHCAFRLYLPGIRRVRTIHSDMRGEAFFGTDFNYEDLGFESLSYTKHKILGEDAWKGRDCYKIESVPEGGWWYARIVRCIDKEGYLPRRTEYYDHAGALFKVRTFDRVETIDSYPTPMEITMRAVPAKTWSRLRFGDAEYDTDLKDELLRVAIGQSGERSP